MIEFCALKLKRNKMLSDNIRDLIDIIEVVLLVYLTYMVYKKQS